MTDEDRMDDDRIDLSALDPSRSPRWDAAVDRVATMAAERHAARATVSGQIRTAALPVLLLAAAAVAVLWLVPPRSRAPSDRTVELPLRVLDWAHRGDPLSFADSLAVLEGTP